MANATNPPVCHNIAKRPRRFDNFRCSHGRNCIKMTKFHISTKVTFTYNFLTNPYRAVFVSEKTWNAFVFHIIDTGSVKWIGNYVHYTEWVRLLIHSQTTVEVWEWMSNFIPHSTVIVITYPCRISNFILHFTVHVITYPCWGLS